MTVHNLAIREDFWANQTEGMILNIVNDGKPLFFRHLDGHA
jgi:hypothetical protein